MSKQILQTLQAGLSLDVSAFLPELILCGAIVLLLLIRLFSQFDRAHLGWVALFFTLVALVVSWFQWIHAAGYDPRSAGTVDEPLNMFSGMLVFDNFSIFLKIFLYFFTA